MRGAALEPSEILFEQRGGLAVATLNRPQALNATSLEIFRAFAPQLQAWNDDPSIKLVLLRANGSRAFSAGGDVRTVYHWRHPAPGAPDLKRKFFADEYRFIYELHRSLKPVVALAHGITFGGGAGLSVNAARRVASETISFSMPEIFIGSIPDVGATRFFGRCPGKIGLYLALTATRLGASDAIYCGLFTHFVPQVILGELSRAFETDPGAMDEVLARHAEPPGAAPLAKLRPAIDRCFGGKSVEEIVAALREEDADWARDALKSMGQASPISLKLIFRQMQQSEGIDLAHALKLEFRLMHHVLDGHDFYEGVRSVLVDKDRKPRWQFPTVDAVPDELIEGYFASLGENELSL
jgi:enoyl-CoA hydratase